MANADRPSGAQPHGEILRVRKYTAGAACYPGDLVTLSSDGKVDPIAVTTPGTDKPKILGVAMTYASADGVEVLVADHPDQLIKIQADGAEIDAQADLAGYYSVVTTAGNATYRRSNMELDSSSKSTATDELLLLIAIDDRVDNALGANVDCICSINNHQLVPRYVAP